MHGWLSLSWISLECREYDYACMPWPDVAVTLKFNTYNVLGIRHKTLDCVMNTLLYIVSMHLLVVKLSQLLLFMDREYCNSNFGDT